MPLFAMPSFSICTMRSAASVSLIHAGGFQSSSGISAKCTGPETILDMRLCGDMKRSESGHSETQTRLSAPLKLFREWLVVEEDPWIFVFAIEPLLQLSHDTQGAIHLPVGREHDERRIFTFRFGRRWHDRVRCVAGLRIDWAVVGGVDKYWGCYVLGAFKSVGRYY